MAEADYEAEIRRIAAQTGESVRRVRAKIEKGGSMDVLHNQVIENKVIDLILQNAEFEEVPYSPEETDVEALDLTAGGGGHADIPEAKPGGGDPSQGGPSGGPLAAREKR